MKQVMSIARKELDSYFGSPMALIFVGIFLLAVLFSFFWVSGFFARGIADVRPLFQWMPLLLIFLVAALTMRQWSEEQRSGTLEVLLTLPVSKVQLVLGKFLAGLFTLALVLTTIWLLIIGLGLLGLGVPPGGEEVARSLWFLVVTIFYGGVWLALAMVFSILFRQPAEFSP